MVLPVLLEENKLTYQDYLTFPDDGKHYEIIDGDLFMSPSPNTAHQDISGNLFELLRGYVRRHRLGRVFDAPYDVVLSEYDVVEPDLVFVSVAKAHIVTELNIQGTPDLLVEILSPSTRAHDRVRKFRRYARFGVPEYWMIDPDAETIEIFTLVEGKFELLHKCGKRGHVKSIVVKGFECAAREIFEGPKD
ncbi:MAG: Uma2 family endonuclease [Chloroflexi bacterium]|nr:Uma2 family endonuclease [Chloroflexota bacterium]